MFTGVGKSGWPMQKEMMSRPWRTSALTSASTTKAFSVPRLSPRRLIGGDGLLQVARRVHRAAPALGVKVAEGASRRRRHVAAVGPPAAQRQPVDHAGLAAQPTAACARRCASPAHRASAASRATPSRARRRARTRAASERSNSCSRNFRSRSGSGMRTGQTTPHWLHSVDACGRSSAFSSPMYDGVRIDPIGPGYTQP